MSDSGYTEKELIFENTPLQNLKNILSDADASMTKQLSLKGGQAIQEPVLLQQGVLKEEIRLVIEKIRSQQDKYLSAAFINKIVCQLCSPETKEEILDKNAPINTYINELDRLISVNTAQRDFEGYR